MLLRFQRGNLIESETSSSDSEGNEYETLKLMESKNPVIRLAVFGKMKKMIESFGGATLKSDEKNLIRGVFVRKIKDYKEDAIAKNKDLSLMDRLLGANNIIR
jgi:hypothetical protein